MQKPLLYIGGDRFVAFKNHNGIPALFAAVKLHCGDVYLPLHQRSCNCRNVPGNVLIVNDKRVVLAVEVRFDSVNITYVNTSAAYAFGNDIKYSAGFARKFYLRRVGVGVFYLFI